MRGRGGLQVVWFKRDLRAADHAALARAAEAGPVLPLYVAEPDFWAQPDASGRHWDFVAESLRALRDDLAALGQPLVIRRGAVRAVLDEIDARWGIAALYAHMETGNGWTYARDRRVVAWCRARGIPWHEYRQNGVERGPSTRDGWAARWEREMGRPQVVAAALAPLEGIEPGAIPTARDLGLPPDPCPGRQEGGRAAGLERLDSFLHRRGRAYRTAMSCPAAGAGACSRLSPHLAWGTLSLREVTQASWARQAAVRADPAPGPWRGALTSFTGRLHWHCHFMQKLEDAPEIEHRNMHRAYDGLRPAEPDAARLAAWAAGETGLPFVDACMRCLRATGWMNFRMRAMLMAVASYHLWLDWRAPGLHLARLFTDYEPGIHWPQVQMQSGTTGINTVRIYNPVKQGHDQDPAGEFTRRWVPELAGLAGAAVHEPWKTDAGRALLGRAYPWPIVDHLAAAREARDRVWALRREAGHRDEAQAIAARHGSRKGRGRAKRKAPSAQLSLPFEMDRP